MYAVRVCSFRRPRLWTGLLIGTVARWRSKLQKVSKLFGVLSKCSKPGQAEQDVEAEDVRWAGRGPGPLQHAFSLQVINGESEVILHKVGRSVLQPLPFD